MSNPTSPAVPPSSPGMHLLALIADALTVPPPAPVPEDEAACLALVSRRAGAVLAACRQALASPGDGGTLYAARDLYGAVSAMPATGYRPAGRPGAASS
ncbi:MAG TPA: hypothetical protein VNF47_01615 [Streptosporangiaceae bacterium]|nr:hypothetical protein [Streptosporangiaceae bacterium]